MRKRKEKTNDNDNECDDYNLKDINIGMVMFGNNGIRDECSTTDIFNGCSIALPYLYLRWRGIVSYSIL